MIPAGYKEQILSIITDKIQADKILHPDEITREVIGLHMGELVARQQSGFFYSMGWHTVRLLVGETIRKQLAIDPEDKQGQLLLPGYSYIQTHYVVKRDGIALGLPAHLIDDDEFDAIAARMRRNADTLEKHADEIGTYKSTRTITPLAPPSSG